MTIYLKTLNYGFLTIVNYLINLCSNWVMQLWSLTKVYGRYFEVLSGLWFPTSLRGSIADSTPGDQSQMGGIRFTVFTSNHPRHPSLQAPELRLTPWSDGHRIFQGFELRHVIVQIR